MLHNRFISIRSGLATVCIVSLIAAAGLAPTAASASTTRGFSPTVYAALADLNGDGTVNAADDSTAFYGDTDIINGALDCDAWASPNDGAAGDGTIDGSDDCTLIGVDGSIAGVTVDVVDGEFVAAGGDPIPDGTRLPAVFNAAQPDNPSIFYSDFAWSTIDGRVDANGNAEIDGEDCHFGLVGSVDVLGSDPGCGFAGTISAGDNGLVDLNSDEAITSADTCRDGCFFGLNVVEGLVTGTLCTLTGTPAADDLTGSAGRDVICGLGGADTLRGAGGRDLIRGGSGNDLMSGGSGDDVLLGGTGPDSARGGPGFDRCTSATTQVSCER